MMPGRPLLFLSSYTPLFTLLTIRFEPQWLWISCGVLTVLGVASVWLLLRPAARSSPGLHVLVFDRDASGSAASYLASYLLPFLTVATPTARDVVAYAGFLLVVATIHLRSAVVQINPLLYLLGYHVLAVSDACGLPGYMITRHLAPPDGRVLATRFRDDVLVDRTTA